MCQSLSPLTVALLKMTECIQARQTERRQEGVVTDEGTPLKMPPCPCGLQCCRALVVFPLRLCHVIWSRWGGRGGSLSRTRLGCQTSCSSNKDCHSNDHSVSLTSNPHCYKKQREGLAGIVGGTTGSNVWYLHQLDRQDGGAHQSPLGLLWLGGARRRDTERPEDTSPSGSWSYPVTLMRTLSKLQMYSLSVTVWTWSCQAGFQS